MIINFYVRFNIIKPPQEETKEMGKGKSRTPNDQRSDSKNRNNPENKAARDNRANQKNPNHKKSK